MKQEPRMLRPNDIKVDMQYQRPINQKHVNEIARDIDPLALGAIMVSQRDDGSYWVLDGQHRLAAMVASGKGSVPMLCLVYTGLSVGDEADVYYMQSKARPIHPVELFKARRFAGEPIACHVAKILDRHGLKVAIGSHPSHVQAPKTLENILMQQGEARLDQVLRIASAIWGNERRSMAAYLLQGVNSFITRYGQEFDEDRLITQMQGVPKATIDADAKSMQKFLQDDTATLYGRVLVHYYNKGLRKNQLAEWNDTFSDRTRRGNLTRLESAGSNATGLQQVS